MSTRTLTAQVAVVGNGVAGWTAATRLARAGVGVLLIGPGLPTDRPPLSKAALSGGLPRLFADSRTIESSGIVAVDGLVTDADLHGHVLTVQARSECSTVHTSHIVLATGCSYEPVRGLDTAHVNATPEGLKLLVPHLRTPRRVLVVGAGLVGVESAITLSRAGHTVTLVDRADRPLDRLHDPLPRIAAVALAEHGVTLITGVDIEGVEQAAGGASVLLTRAHGVIEADVLLAATGGRPAAPPGLQGTDVPVEVDGEMRVPGLTDVFVVGDCAAPPHARFGRLRFPQWDAAVGTAEQAADAILGTAGTYDRMPYWWSDLGGLRLAEYGIADAASAWEDRDGMHVGTDDGGAVVCVLLVGQPRRGREALALVASAGRAPGARTMEQRRASA